MGAIKDPIEVTRYLKHVGLVHLPPSRAPPRSQALQLDFDQDVYDLLDALHPHLRSESPSLPVVWIQKHRICGDYIGRNGGGANVTKISTMF